MKSQKIPFGKMIGRKIYFHSAVIQGMPESIRKQVAAAERLYQKYPKRLADDRVRRVGFVICAVPNERVSFLFYPDFWTEGHPTLLCSFTVNLVTKRVARREHHRNPPVLHRKELMLPTWHAYYKRFARLTRAEERAGLLDSCYRVGRLTAWRARLLERGWDVRKHQLVRKGVEDGNPFNREGS